MLSKIFSQGIRDAISKLENNKSQVDKYNIGSTVQPIVDVNLGVKKYMAADGVAGNVVTSLVVPDKKVWWLMGARVYIDTDATVADRVMGIRHVFNEDVTNFVILICQSGVVAANGTGNVYLSRSSVSNNNMGYADAFNMAGEVFEAGDRITFQLDAGVAGDIYNYDVRIKEFDVI